MEAKDEVITTLLTVGALFSMAFRTPVVPMMAGSRRSFLLSVTLKWNYNHISVSHSLKRLSIS